MKFNRAYDHHHGVTEWRRRDLHEWLVGAFEAPAVKIQRQCTPAIREHVENQFINEGWSLTCSIKTR